MPPYLESIEASVVRRNILLIYCLGLQDPQTNSANLAQARQYFSEVGAREAMELVDAVMQKVDDLEQVKTIVTRMLHSFTKGLNQTTVGESSRAIPYIQELRARNLRLGDVLDRLKPIVITLNQGKLDKPVSEALVSLLEELKGLLGHYEQKENLLFPLVEQHIAEHRCVQLMWAIHDDVRLGLKNLLELLSHESMPLEELNRLLGRLFFDVRSMIFREEQVLLPAVLDRIPLSRWHSLSAGQYEHGQVGMDDAFTNVSGDTVDLITGCPSAAQLIQIFNNLPVDITLVDANDQVVYFNTPADRIFPRTKSVVGRKVQNCHPPKSVHIVEDIINAFRERRQTEADFRLTLRGRYILIRYVALYDNAGEYAGTLEISQDITELRALEGDKRLLDWRIHRS
jgi:PAS domain S-box-containing protein